MEFYYYSDEIKLDSDSNCGDLEQLDKLVGVIYNSFINNGVDLNGKNIFYFRNKDAKSILGIQFKNGDKKDINNYLVFDACSNVSSSDVYCDIDFHIAGKGSNKGIEIASEINDDVNEFFYSTEEYLISDCRYSRNIRIFREMPFVKNTKKKNIFMKLLKRIEL